MITRDLPMNHPPRPQAPVTVTSKDFRANHPALGRVARRVKECWYLGGLGFLVNSVLNS